LLLGLAFNLYRLRHPTIPAGCKQSHLKSCVLKLRILQGLRARFAEMRILKGLGTGWQEKGVGCGLEGWKVGMLKGQGEPELNALRLRARRGGRRRADPSLREG
jgi:hypothetical protein